MHRNFRLFMPAVCVLMLLCAGLASMIFLLDHRVFMISAGLCTAVFIAVIIMLQVASRRSKALFEDIDAGILHTRTDSFIDSPIPVLTVYEGGEVIWCSERCRTAVFEGHDMRGMHISEALPGLDISQDSPAEGVDIICRGKDYTAFVSCGKRSGSHVAIVYLVDDTQLKFYTHEYYQTQPSVAIIVVDNFEELLQDYKDTERAQLMNQIERMVEKYVSDNHGFFTRINRDRYMAVIQERGIANIVGGKFSLLDRVRDVRIGNRMSATVSIGLGREAENLYESEDMARQALDMCLGRGGDQAAIKTQNGYEFYGGVSKGIEKRTKVKTRIIASALSELIEASGNVIIMGHHFADLDSLGACVGMLKVARAMGKPSVVCLNRQKNLAPNLLQRLLEGGSSEGDFISPAEALVYCTPNTLLIIVDTHLAHVTESEEVYRACRNVVVIDHHRKLVGYIENAVIFYHEPFASSASEMVGELLQYFPVRPQISKIEAEALLAGIMLDTGNFVLRTG
ncbi:MAG: DHH family phosphoesterase, partial [Oscillospiraceae bacterium]|nr:DHH family phosphoesterase [Oscillospiraceae bacterium]